MAASGSGALPTGNCHSLKMATLTGKPSAKQSLPVSPQPPYSAVKDEEMHHTIKDMHVRGARTAKTGPLLSSIIFFSSCNSVLRATLV